MENEKIGESIYVDLPIKGIDQVKFDEKIKSLNLKKPSPYPPSIEKDALKVLGFNCETLKEQYVKNISINSNNIFYYRKFHYTEKNFYHTINSYIIEFAENIVKNPHKYVQPIVLEFCKNLIKYINFAKNHEKTKKYLEYKKEYNDILNKYKKEFNFLYSPYNSTGYLLTLLNTKTNKVFYFLVGTKQKVSDSFYDWKDFRVLRAKKVISNEELNGMLIFE